MGIKEIDALILSRLNEDIVQELYGILLETLPGKLFDVEQIDQEAQVGKCSDPATSSDSQLLNYLCTDPSTDRLNAILWSLIHHIVVEAQLENESLKAFTGQGDEQSEKERHEGHLGSFFSFVSPDEHLNQPLRLGVALR